MLFERQPAHNGRMTKISDIEFDITSIALFMCACSACWEKGRLSSIWPERNVRPSCRSANEIDASVKGLMIFWNFQCTSIGCGCMSVFSSSVHWFDALRHRAEYSYTCDASAQPKNGKIISKGKMAAEHWCESILYAECEALKESHMQDDEHISNHFGYSRFSQTPGHYSCRRSFYWTCIFRDIYLVRCT